MRHVRLASCGSTNDEARALFGRGDELPFLVSAEEQTRGRGRAGRSWSHLAGNFAGSVVIEATRALATEPGSLALLAGLAIRDALIDCGAEPARLMLKWPNDVLFGERKVAGVLAEMVDDGRRRAFVVGIGVNLRQAPESTLYPAGSVFAGDAPEPQTFGDRLAASLVAWAAQAEKEGTGAIIAAWRRHAWRMGDPLVIRTPTGPVEGFFEDVDRHGRMLLRLPGGELRTITAGDAAHR